MEARDEEFAKDFDSGYAMTLSTVMVLMGCGTTLTRP
ncbi:hypothetical protein Dpo_1c01050 [Desulfotignum phosphitoxidans DSM 13687]|jgi:hypothetical protein|uniref:Uncharacterized protein n=1 Tax=Desulfotignum phosphitoxidans DSM 13687 TaxID=1286635 RepID=S0G567_9BACT|nr:hypothetical protein Dpo_1c01050 [Desulfotignum phosphitoxidans DSM 13687]